MNWHQLSLEQIQKKLGVDFKKGLSGKEVEERRTRYGFNELPKGKKTYWWQFFLGQFKNPLIFILVIAAFLTLWLREFIDMTVILLAIFVNVLIGFWHEFRSNNVFEKLQTVVKTVARVKRQEKIFEIDAKELVPGDIIFLLNGIKVPADVRILSAKDLEINESLLTGESLAVKKQVKNLSENIVLGDRVNMAYAGAIVEKGEGVAIVVSVGAQTEIGQIAKLTSDITKEKTPLQERLSRLGRVIALLVLISVIIILVVGIWESYSFIKIFTIAVAVAVAAIPEGLPAALSVVLAVASQRIFQKNGLIKKLIGTETLGSTSVICTDKTGTLTEGKMKVKNLLKVEDENEAILVLALANEAIITEKDNKKEVTGEATDRAKMEFFFENGGDLDKVLQDFPRRAMLPFDPEKKYIASFHILKDKSIKILISGAPEELLLLSSKNSDEKEKLTKEVEIFAEKGFRMIGLAERIIQESDVSDWEDRTALRAHIKDLTFIGLAALRDPIRKDVKESMIQTRTAGIRVIMVTGDHRLTAMSIGRDLGFRTDLNAIIDGKELDAMSDEELMKRIDDVDVFNRVSPKHKMRIVETLKSKDAVIAMTGDGINDAPALKSADIGISLNSGTDVTKEAADLVLLNNSFSIITEAVRQGRIAFDNIRKVVIFLLSGSFSELIIILVSLILRIPLPLTAAQILWVNLVEDGPPNFALAFEPGEKDVMLRRPFKRKERILNSEAKVLIFIVGLITDFTLVGIFLWLYYYSNWSIEHIRTFIFAAIGSNALFYVFSLKSLSKPIWRINILNNYYLLGSVAIGFLMILAGIYLPLASRLLGTVPLSFIELMAVVGLGLMGVTLIELVKFLYHNFRPAKAN